MTLWRIIWAGIAGLALALALLLPEGWMWPTSQMQLPLASKITAFMKWLTDSAALGPVSFKDVTRTAS